jgi:hypothetical protein
MHRTSPPDLPPLLPLTPDVPHRDAPQHDVPQRNVVASWQRRSALHHAITAIIHLICAAFALQWLTDDWKAQWGDQTFVDAAYLSYGGTLIGAFGKWLLMALLLLCLALAAAQFALAAVVFRYSTHRSALMVFAWLSILTPPLGTVAGLYALRRLKAAEMAPDERRRAR